MSHTWMDMAGRLYLTDPALFRATSHRLVDLNEEL